jgi:hypothetical protein
MTITCVVDQDIDRTDVLLDLAHGRIDGIEVRDVEDHPVRALAVQSFKCNSLVFTPHRADHGVPDLQRGFGKGAAETCAGAGDQDSLQLCVSHAGSPHCKGVHRGGDQMLVVVYSAPRNAASIV